MTTFHGLYCEDNDNEDEDDDVDAYVATDDQELSDVQCAVQRSECDRGVAFVLVLSEHAHNHLSRDCFSR
jgi:hypothetical protein